jgi:3-dehydroquinate synthetase
MIEAMQTDKKKTGGKLRFVLSPRIGEARSIDSVSNEAVKSVLDFFLAPVGKKRATRNEALQ